MRYVGIDSSLNHTGLTIIDENEKIIVSHTINPDISLTPFKRIIQTISELRLYLEGDDIGCVVIEDSYLGPNFQTAKNALSLLGCVKYDYWLRKKEEMICLMAVSARKLCSINPRCNKAEVQLFVMNKYKLGSDDFRKDISKQIYEVSAIEDVKVRNKVMSKISKVIEREIDLDEHQADSVILALSAKRYKEAALKLQEENNHLSKETKEKLRKRISQIYVKKK